MRCDFDSTKTLSAWNEAVIISFAVSLSGVLVFLSESLKVSGKPALLFSIYAAVFGAVLLLSIIAMIFFSFFNGGVIRAWGKQVIISHNFMGGRAFISRIEYRDISYVEYHVKAVHSRWGFDRYDLNIVINKKSGKKITLSKSLDIRESFPTESPDEYKELLKKQPLINICKYINERSRLL
ncbi:MAG: hypothetical protein K2J73_09185 [Oscillospiraceae bacterium]|nr:hypothetical protein [Oscillospiraceae bacterium]